MYLIYDCNHKHLTMLLIVTCNKILSVGVKINSTKTQMLILTEQCHVFNRMHNKHKIMILSLLKNYSEIGKWNVCVPLKIQYSPNVV